jgi:hypothetical protein
VRQAFQNGGRENEMKFKQVLFGASLALVGGVAAGGSYRPVPLTIDFDGKVATGGMYSARVSGNPNAFIGCGIRTPVAGVTFAFCQANLGPLPGDGSAPESVSCFTEDPSAIATIGALDDFSWISFRWDDNGECTSVSNSTQSFYLPDFYKTDKVK